ncbi:hypothetical protein DFA_05221 [Cavenderia fasciculata]|uniref:Uncharacterized protein n=1 Tax=Cavenderia fasciculata TaxID=261658 RepID=F4PNN8_CACFS|nr:uncharacterized protein DFA_05221 [Cavenderia fasciculata]EGG23091.1 hypothetical protein DFA_05221 [Cavenderia fasciculata]|eukprot:XP_004360942.1 hypothetical protein DFA_05221 [Cavenderia fasciculata]
MNIGLSHDSNVILLCGLPASGKSNLCKTLIEYLTKLSSTPQSTYCRLDIWYLEFDSIYNEVKTTQDIASVDQDTSGSTTTYWKMTRQEIINQVQSILKNEHLGEEPTMRTTILPLFKPTNTIQLGVPSPDGVRSKRLILLDDNFHLKSMRYPYYRICRDFNSGFGVIYINRDVDDCKVYNIEREKRDDLKLLPLIKVTGETIDKMNREFEPPNNPNIKWEFNNTLTNNNNNNNNNNLDRIESFWNEIVDLLNKQLFVAPSDTIVDTQQRQQDRQVCENNLIHQLDIATRSVVGTLLSDLFKKTTNIKNNNNSIITKEVSNYKKSFLQFVVNDLRKFQQQQEEEEEDNSSTTIKSNPLFIYYLSLFKLNLNNKFGC